MSPTRERSWTSFLGSARGARAHSHALAFAAWLWRRRAWSDRRRGRARRRCRSVQVAAAFRGVLAERPPDPLHGGAPGGVVAVGIVIQRRGEELGKDALLVHVLLRPAPHVQILEAYLAAAANHSEQVSPRTLAHRVVELQEGLVELGGGQLQAQLGRFQELVNVQIQPFVEVGHQSIPELGR